MSAGRTASTGGATKVQAKLSQFFAAPPKPKVTESGVDTLAIATSDEKLAGAKRKRESFPPTSRAEVSVDATNATKRVKLEPMAVEPRGNEARAELSVIKAEHVAEDMVVDTVDPSARVSSEPAVALDDEQEESAEQTGRVSVKNEPSAAVASAAGEIMEEATAPAPKGKKVPKKMEPWQDEILLAEFAKNKYPDKATYQRLMKQLKIDDIMKIKRWFTFRRTYKPTESSHRFEDWKRDILIEHFATDPYPTNERYAELSGKLGGEDIKRLKRWFVWRRDTQMERSEKRPIGGQSAIPSTREGNAFLLAEFEKNPYPSTKEIAAFREQLGLPPSTGGPSSCQVYNFFRSRRIKLRMTGQLDSATEESLRHHGIGMQIFNREELAALNQEFDAKPYTTVAQQAALAARLKLDPKKVKSWWARKQTDVIPDAAKMMPMAATKLIALTPEQVAVLEQRLQQDVFPTNTEILRFQKAFGFKRVGHRRASCPVRVYFSTMRKRLQRRGLVPVMPKGTHGPALEAFSERYRALVAECGLSWDELITQIGGREANLIRPQTADEGGDDAINDDIDEDDEEDAQDDDIEEVEDEAAEDRVIDDMVQDTSGAEVVDMEAVVELDGDETSEPSAKRPRLSE